MAFLNDNTRADQDYTDPNIQAPDPDIVGPDGSRRRPPLPPPIPPPATPPPTTPPAPGSTPPPNDPYGIDALYKQYGITDGGQGSGFADRAYWLAHPSEIQNGRLAADLAGTGRDQPTGTPGTGPWSTSGQGAPGSSNYDSGYASAPGGSSSGFGSGGFGGFSSLSNPVNFNDPGSQYLPSPQDSQLFRTLMERANQSLSVNPNDPVIKGQTEAFRDTQTRGVRDYLAQMAEQGGAYGNPSSETRGAYEKAGQNTASFQSQLLQNELNARRQEIQNALSEQGSLLSQQDQLGLQKELGLIDAQIRNKGVNNQFWLGQGNLGLGYTNSDRNYALGLGSQGLQQQGINSQNDQFAANFGQQATQNANYWDDRRRNPTG